MRLYLHILKLSLFACLLGIPALGHAATYCVDNTTDPGAGVAGDCAATCDGTNDCSLSDAVAAANANNGVDTITFAAGAQTHNITTTLTLSDATGGTTLDGGAADPTVSHDVVINGTGKTGINCLTITSADNIIKGLTIQDCNSGILINNAAATGNKIQNNYIGTNVAGTGAVANNNGVNISAGTGNIIGTDGDGVNDAGERNVISGNSYGVAPNSASNVVAGNYIGVNAAGTGAIPNTFDGVNVGGSGNRIGTNGDGTSDTLERNVISGNSRHGITFGGPSCVIAGNYIGVAADGSTDLGNADSGINSGNQSGSNSVIIDGD